MWYFKGVAGAFDTKDPKAHLNSEDASYREVQLLQRENRVKGKVRNKIGAEQRVEGGSL